MNKLLRVEELKVGIVLFLAINGLALGFSVIALLSLQMLKPLIWPDIVGDLNRLVSPEECILAAYPKWCDENKHHVVVSSETCPADGGAIAPRVGQRCLFM